MVADHFVKMTRPNYVYAAKLERVVDGDTYELMVDLGCSVWHKLTVRLLGVNTPETKGETRTAGLAARREAEIWFSDHHSFVIELHKEPKRQTDSFRRYLALIYGTKFYTEHQESLSEHLLATHHAVLFRTE